MRAFLLGCLLTTILCSCNSAGPKTAGTDTGNPVLTATVRDSMGVALKSAKVIIYSVADSLHKAQIIDSVYTDSLGQVSMRLPSQGSYSVEVYWKDSLGLFAQVHVPSDTGVNVTAQTLVNFPVAKTLKGDSVAAYFSQTGRVVAAGSNVMLPQGLWRINYTRFGTNTIDTTSSLSVQIGDAKGRPEWLATLGLAVWRLDSMGVVPLGYVALSHLPTDPLLRARFDSACNLGGFSAITECSNNDSCRVWQWESSWVDLGGAPVLAAVVTGFGNVQCVLFPDGIVSACGYFNSLGDVRKGL